MTANKDESQAAQENKTPPVKQKGKEKQPALPEKEAEKPNERDQPLVAGIEKEKTQSQPISTGFDREGGPTGSHGILDKIRGFSADTLYRIGNIGLILVQALFFLAANFLANFSSWWGDRSVIEAAGYSLVYAIPFVLCLSLYYIAVWDKGKKPPRQLIRLAIVAIIAVLPAGIEFFVTPGVVNSTWWKLVKLIIGTACQGAAGYIAWKAADLIPKPSPEESKESA